MAGLTRVVSTSTVRPASGESHLDFNRRIELTSSDVQFLWFNYSQLGLIFIKPEETTRSLSGLVEHLKATLSLALDKLYPLAGRLVATENDGDIITSSLSIACNGAGVKFVHAEVVNSVTVADILDSAVVPMETLADMFPMTGVPNHLAVGSDLSLLAVQVTELDGGVFLGLSQNHLAADGTTFWNFVNLWSELSRGDQIAISKRGSFNFSREFVDFPIRVPFCSSKILTRLVPRAPLVQRRILHFPKERVAELKAKANTSEPRRCGTDREISSLQALMAHLWVCITRGRALPESEEVSYMIAVDLRSRLQPPLPQSYVGNAICTILVTCTAGELLDGGMGWAARQINKAIVAQTAEEARKFFYDPPQSCQRPIPLEMPPNMLVTGGWQWFDVFGNDFGWGKPLALRGGPVLGPGKLNVTAGAIKGSIDFEATLLPETFRALSGDPEFTRYSVL